MKIFPASDVREIDQFTIEHEPIVSIDLMERAANKVTDWFVKNFRPYHRVVVFTGPGNNGGDSLAVARLLMERQFKVTCCMLAPRSKLTKDCTINLERFEEQDGGQIFWIKAVEDIPEIDQNAIIVDGIFGSGLTRKVEGVYASIISAINFMENTVIAIDIPSGLFGEDNRKNNLDAIIKANYTLSFQFPFLSFFFPENEQFVGEWVIEDIRLHKKVIEAKQATYKILQKDVFADNLPKRGKFAHKGTFGHALVIGGSYGMMGAAVLTSKAVLRSGAGLVTAHVPSCGMQILQTSFSEAIVHIDKNEFCFSSLPELKKYTALAVGPGLGSSDLSLTALEELLDTVQVPLVIDADALNMIATAKDLISKIPEMSVLTPHPKEFDRLLGASEDHYTRHLKQIEFSKQYKQIVVLKGAYTGISLPDGRYFFNTTGNPGMATAGSGDVLTGIIVSLLAQDMRADFAAMAGVYLHGLAGACAAEEWGEEAMIASDIIKSLGKARRKLESE